MNIIKAFNQTIGYIEENLTEKLDEKIIQQLSGYSFPLFSRIFSIMVGYPLSEYIRFRKLSCAAVDLREKDERVIDIAFKYGYESPDSFTAAFKKFHGYTPNEVKKGKTFKIFSPILLSLNVSGGKNMDIKIEKKKGFKIAGIRKKVNENTNFPEVWNKLFSKVDSRILENLGNGQSYGACCNFKNKIEVLCEKNIFDYMAGYDVKDMNKAKEAGLEILEVPEAEYAVIKLKGAIPECIQEGWKYVTNVFFPEQGYKHAGTPDFEVYSEGNPESIDYEMELWVPVEKL